LQQVRRVFYEYDGTVSKDESGYLFSFQDRRGVSPLKDTNVDLTGLVNMTSDCAKYMMCGMPLYDHRWVEAMDDTMWLPRENPVWTPAEPILELRNKTVLADGKTIRFQFNLNCTDHTSIFINPNEDVTVSSWSFLEEYLTTNSPPYHIYYLFDMEIDLQYAYGAYVKWNLVNMYQGIQNVVVKLTPKGSTSENYVLVNSHFDSQPTSPSTGDDGHMVVSILEVLRVISSSTQSFEHPIVFLINGSEENSLQASHGFIAYHKWAKNCK